MFLYNVVAVVGWMGLDAYVHTQHTDKHEKFLLWWYYDDGDGSGGGVDEIWWGGY